MERKKEKINNGRTDEENIEHMQLQESVGIYHADIKLSLPQLKCIKYSS